MSRTALQADKEYVIARPVTLKSSRGLVLQLQRVCAQREGCIPYLEVRTRRNHQVMTDANNTRVASFRKSKACRNDPRTFERTIDVVCRDRMLRWNVEQSGRNVLFLAILEGSRTATLCWRKHSPRPRPIKESSTTGASSFRKTSRVVHPASKEWTCSIVLPDVKSSRRDVLARIKAGKALQYILPFQSRAISPAMVHSSILATMAWVLCHVEPEESFRYALPRPFIGLHADIQNFTRTSRDRERDAKSSPEVDIAQCEASAHTTGPTWRTILDFFSCFSVSSRNHPIRKNCQSVDNSPASEDN